MKITLRDHFAHNAPDVPDWYQVIALEYPKFSMKEPVHPKHFSNEEIKKLYFGWLEDPCWDLDHPELKKVAKEWELYWKQKTIYHNQRNAALRIHKITSWRYFYADQMLSMRQKKCKWFKHPQFAFFFMLLLFVCSLILACLENYNVRIF